MPTAPTSAHSCRGGQSSRPHLPGREPPAGTLGPRGTPTPPRRPGPLSSGHLGQCRPPARYLSQNRPQRQGRGHLCRPPPAGPSPARCQPKAGLRPAGGPARSRRVGKGLISMQTGAGPSTVSAVGAGAAGRAEGAGALTGVEVRAEGEAGVKEGGRHGQGRRLPVRAPAAPARSAPSPGAHGRRCRAQPAERPQRSRGSGGAGPPGCGGSRGDSRHLRPGRRAPGWGRCRPKTLAGARAGGGLLSGWGGTSRAGGGPAG